MRRVLVTAGGTRVPIDAVRYLGNSSTGRTGSAIADVFARAGWQVTLLRAESAVAEPAGVVAQTFVTVDDLDSLLLQHLGGDDYDLVVHAAAVSDFRIEALPGKLDSSGPAILTLQPGPKLLPKLKDYSRNPAIRVVGFKLTSGEDAAAAVRKLFARGGVDRVVHNDTAGIDRAKGIHRTTLFSADGAVATFETDVALAAGLIAYGAMP